MTLVCSHNVPMNKGRTIHAFDAGCPSALRSSGLAARFHAWRGVSGRRYLATVHTAATAPTYAGAVIVLARPKPTAHASPSGPAVRRLLPRRWRGSAPR